MEIPRNIAISNTSKRHNEITDSKKIGVFKENATIPNGRHMGPAAPFRLDLIKYSGPGHRGDN